MGAVKEGSSSLRERYSRPSSERFDQAAPISARPTKTRWLGALSLAALLSATMRTPLACRLRVMISPWKSFPTFLKEPMVAMSLLLFVFRARDHRGLDGDGQAEDDRRRTRFKGRSEAEDAVVASFLPREEW